MKLIIQRVNEASVSINHTVYSQIGKGLLVLLGIHADDQLSQIEWSIKKLIHLRIFSDEQGKMNHSLLDVEGSVLVVSQFTLYGNCLKGRRPDFLQAALPNQAEKIYQQFVDELRKKVSVVQTGIFGANMQISLVNDGPVTFILDESERKPSTNQT